MEAGDCPPLDMNAMCTISVKSYLKREAIRMCGIVRKKMGDFTFDACSQPW